MPPQKVGRALGAVTSLDMEQRRRLVERLTEPSYLDRLERTDIDALREMRDECREGENELSFERRLCQARIDILTAELERRAGHGNEDLLARLPEILAAEGASMGTGEDNPLPRRAPNYAIPRNADVPRRRVAEILGEQTLSRLAQIDTDEIKSIVASLGDHERRVSELRRRVQDVMDRLQAEIVRRYTSGEADPSAALR
jgi:vacuolar-type H+-ATPase subunit C/Vma6